MSYVLQSLRGAEKVVRASHEDRDFRNQLTQHRTSGRDINYPWSRLVLSLTALQAFT